MQVRRYSHLHFQEARELTVSIIEVEREAANRMMPVILRQLSTPIKWAMRRNYSGDSTSLT